MLIRVTPGVVADTHAAILTGHAGSKFGFSLAQAPRAIERLQRRAPGRTCKGLHMHIGSQLFDLEPWRLAVEAIATLGDFAAYDLGGGLAVAYTADRRPPIVAEYVDAMVATADELLGPGKQLVDRARPRARRQRRRDALHASSRSRTSTCADGTRPLRRRRRRACRDNLRPMLYDAPYEADLADRVGAERRRRARSSASTASPATC